MKDDTGRGTTPLDPKAAEIGSGLGTDRLCHTVHGRDPLARDWVGGGNARILHDAADMILALRSRLEHVEREMDAICSKLEQTERSRDEFERMWVEVVDLENDARQEIDRLRESRAQYERNLTAQMDREYAETIRDLRARLDDALKCVADWKGLVGQYQDKYDDQNDEMAKLRKECDTCCFRTDRESLRARLEQAEREKDDLRHENLGVLNNNGYLQEQIAALRAREEEARWIIEKCRAVDSEHCYRRSAWLDGGKEAEATKKREAMEQCGIDPKEADRG